MKPCITISIVLRIVLYNCLRCCIIIALFDRDAVLLLWLSVMPYVCIVSCVVLYNFLWGCIITACIVLYIVLYKCMYYNRIITACIALCCITACDAFPFIGSQRTWEASALWDRSQVPFVCLVTSILLSLVSKTCSFLVYVICPLIPYALSPFFTPVMIMNILMKGWSKVRQSTMTKIRERENDLESGEVDRRLLSPSHFHPLRWAPAIQQLQNSLSP